MFEIGCDNCREVSFFNDRLKNKTIRCPLCNNIIQVGEIKKEVVRNINIIEDHEIRIQKIETATEAGVGLTFIALIIIGFAIYGFCVVCTS